ncbi:triadin-like isoform X2 [Drosophila eugracilis]|uniref:triadin-like isoform X2 n=1 Tax=Drosophila eugracilis TaxID=29029 RepID=UPI0007E8911E|nr:triadin-like isoform X2 [Drosophila eugracilis]
MGGQLQKMRAPETKKENKSGVAQVIEYMGSDDYLKIPVAEVCRVISVFGGSVDIKELITYFENNMEDRVRDLISRSVHLAVMKGLFRNKIEKVHGKFLLPEFPKEEEAAEPKRARKRSIAKVQSQRSKRSITLKRRLGKTMISRGKMIEVSPEKSSFKTTEKAAKSGVKDIVFAEATPGTQKKVPRKILPVKKRQGRFSQLLAKVFKAKPTQQSVKMAKERKKNLKSRAREAAGSDSQKPRTSKTKVPASSKARPDEVRRERESNLLNKVKAKKTSVTPRTEEPATLKGLLVEVRGEEESNQLLNMVKAKKISVIGKVFEKPGKKERSPKDIQTESKFCKCNEERADGTTGSG